MIRGFLAAGLWMALTTAAAAQPDPIIELKSRRAPSDEEPRGAMFISPMGEPFRGHGGLAAWLAGADADHDGGVTLAEFRADALRFFKLLDVNGDGVLDAFEIQAYERERAPEIGGLALEDSLRGDQREGRGGGRRGAEPRGPSAGREGAARYSLINAPQPVSSADEDWNGRVTMAEWTHTATRRFGTLDKAQTGRLTLGGLQAPPPTRKKR